MVADAKLTALTELTAEPADDDWLYLVDKSDTTDDAAGSSRKLLVERVRGNGGRHWPLDLGTNDAWYLGQIMGANSASFGALTAERVQLCPFVVNRTLTVTGVYVELQATGGTIARLGIYRANVATPHQPDALVDDHGTVATNGSTGPLSITGLSVVLTPDLYYAAIVSDGTPSFRYNYTLPAGFVGSPSVDANAWPSDFYYASGTPSSALSSDISAETFTVTFNTGSTAGWISRLKYKWTE
jgi:hypothetical protein